MSIKCRFYCHISEIECYQNSQYYDPCDCPCVNRFDQLLIYYQYNDSLRLESVEERMIVSGRSVTGISWLIYKICRRLIQQK